ncbi:MAG TPA: hypothetical protein VFA37_05370 [Gaiellaceae bacterium]|nr:hypothetical protein [Gaiellaceae bacterium]
MPRGLIGIVVALVGVVLLAGCGGSGGISLPCSPEPQGHLCLKVFHNGSTVTDAIAYLSATESPLAGKTWRLVLATDGGTFPGRTHHGLPPDQTFCKDQAGHTVTTGDGCHDTLAEERASVGDFPRFAVPKKLPTGTQLCVSEEILAGGSWRTQTTPTRACAKVS